MNSCARLFSVLILVLVVFKFVDAHSPKREFRGAWIATVLNLDWPSSRGLVPDMQKAELISLLDALQSVGVNAVIFQIRPECDALYNSPYEPWSYWLTGEQARAPNPYYDPLQFAIEEANKRGMELHAWFNPYRAERLIDNYALSPQHLVRQRPSWVIQIGTFKFLNPGLPEVRDHVSKIIADVVRRYDVDGVHMDDYFYPYSPNNITTQDTATFSAYMRGFENIHDWRRDNVNLLIKQIYDSVQAIKPVVKFGMSPFGIWKNNVPPGITGMSAYDVIYCNAVAWLQGRYIDYIAPQLYWRFGGGQDYAQLQPWWGTQLNGRHYYTGNATYRIRQDGWPVSEIGDQIKFNRAQANAHGSIQFRALNLRNNDSGIADHLRSDVFYYPSAIPVMAWKETVPPDIPRNLRTSAVAGTNRFALQWDSPIAASDGDTAKRYVAYRFTTPSPQSSDMEIARNLIVLTGQSGVVPSARIDTVRSSYYYAVSSIDKNNNESGLSNMVTIQAPVGSPTLAYPSNGEQDFPHGGRLRWNRAPSALAYQLQVARDAGFSDATLLARFNTSDTVATPTGFFAQETYYWRVIAGSQGEVSPYSAAWSFRTGWPKAPILIAPLNILNTPRFPIFVWTRSGGTSFRLRIVNFVTRLAEVDTTVNDTIATSNKGLEPGRVYTWQVLASNAYGSSEWSEEGRFRVDPTVFAETLEGLPTEYELAQNYPNPFNAATRIRFAIPSGGATSLRVYDLLGREVAVLMDETLPAGIYTGQFDASQLSSGMYIYVLTAGGNRISKKMLLTK